MVKKPKSLRIGRMGARTATKMQEKNLVSRCRELAKHPEYLIPECTPECGKDPFDKMARTLKRIQEKEDDRTALVKLIKGGDHLARAYAAALLIALDGKAPILSTARYPWGEVNFARKERIKQDQLVGVQHHNEAE